MGTVGLLALSKSDRHSRRCNIDVQEQKLWHDKSLCMQAGVSLVLWLHSEGDCPHWTASTIYQELAVVQHKQI